MVLRRTFNIFIFVFCQATLALASGAGDGSQNLAGANKFVQDTLRSIADQIAKSQLDWINQNIKEAEPLSDAKKLMVIQRVDQVIAPVLGKCLTPTGVSFAEAVAGNGVGDAKFVLSAALAASCTATALPQMARDSAEVIVDSLLNEICDNPQTKLDPDSCQKVVVASKRAASSGTQWCAESTQRAQKVIFNQDATALVASLAHSNAIVSCFDKTFRQAAGETVAKKIEQQFQKSNLGLAPAAVSRIAEAAKQEELHSCTSAIGVQNAGSARTRDEFIRCTQAVVLHTEGAAAQQIARSSAAKIVSETRVVDAAAKQAGKTFEMCMYKRGSDALASEAAIQDCEKVVVPDLERTLVRSVLEESVPADITERAKVISSETGLVIGCLQNDSKRSHDLVPSAKSVAQCQTDATLRIAERAVRNPLAEAGVDSAAIDRIVDRRVNHDFKSCLESTRREPCGLEHCEVELQQHAIEDGAAGAIASLSGNVERRQSTADAEQLAVSLGAIFSPNQIQDLANSAQNQIHTCLDQWAQRRKARDCSVKLPSTAAPDTDKPELCLKQTVRDSVVRGCEVEIKVRAAPFMRVQGDATDDQSIHQQCENDLAIHCIDKKLADDSLATLISRSIECAKDYVNPEVRKLASKAADQVQLLCDRYKACACDQHGANCADAAKTGLKALLASYQDAGEQAGFACPTPSGKAKESLPDAVDHAPDYLIQAVLQEPDAACGLAKQAILQLSLATVAPPSDRHELLKPLTNSSDADAVTYAAIRNFLRDAFNDPQQLGAFALPPAQLDRLINQDLSTVIRAEDWRKFREALASKEAQTAVDFGANPLKVVEQNSDLREARDKIIDDVAHSQAMRDFVSQEIGQGIRQQVPTFIRDNVPLVGGVVASLFGGLLQSSFVGEGKAFDWSRAQNTAEGQEAVQMAIDKIVAPMMKYYLEPGHELVPSRKGSSVAASAAASTNATASGARDALAEAKGNPQIAAAMPEIEKKVLAALQTKSAPSDQNHDFAANTAPAQSSVLNHASPFVGGVNCSRSLP